MIQTQIGYASLQNALWKRGLKLVFTCTKEKNDTPWQFVCNLEIYSREYQGVLGCRIIREDDRNTVLDLSSTVIKADSPDELFEKVMEKIDLEKTITKVWEYRHHHDVFSNFSNYLGTWKFNFQAEEFQKV